MPREGTETILQCVLLTLQYSHNLEIRCPERGRKLSLFFALTPTIVCGIFGNKMPREGTETCIALLPILLRSLIIWK